MGVEKIYSAHDKMCLLMAREHDAIRIISRFGLPFGVGEQTIDEVCAAHGVHTPTFLAVVNYKLHQTDVAIEKVDIDTLHTYLKNAHTYFVDFMLPQLRHSLIEAIYPNDTDSKIPLLILKSFDEFVAEIRCHMEREDGGRWTQHHQTGEPHITDKLSEIKNLIIRYYPSDILDVKHTYALIAVMNDLYDSEQDFITHCAIEDDILLPALATEQARNDRNSPQDSLSEREKEVLVQVAQGRSNKEIADVLCLSTHTVITHRKNIAAKLNIHSTAGLTIYAIANGLISI